MAKTAKTTKLATKTADEETRYYPIPERGAYGYIHINDIGLAVWNYKITTEATMRSLSQNLLRNGQVENVLIRIMDSWTHPFEMTNGNHRLEVFQEIVKQYNEGTLLEFMGGKPEITKGKLLPKMFSPEEYEEDPKSIPPLYRLTTNPDEFLINDKAPMLNGWIYCFNLGRISDAAAQRIALETNETGFNPDPFQLADLIKGISQDFDPDDLISTLPYSNEEMNNFLSLSDFDFSIYDTPPDAGEGLTGGNGGEGSGEVKIVIHCNTQDEPGIREALRDLLDEFPDASIDF